MLAPTDSRPNHGRATPHGARSGDRPRLVIAAPVLSGFLALAAGFAVVIGGAALIPLSAAPGYVARLAATSTAHPVIASRAGRVRSVHVRDGDIVKAGQLLVRLDTEEIIERGRQLRIQVEHTTRLLATARRGAGLGVPGLIDDGADGMTAGANARVHGETIARIERDLTTLGANLAEIDLDLLHTEVTAIADGQISGLAWLAPGARVAPQSTLATIEPRSNVVTLDVAVPVGLATDVARRDGRRVSAHARALVGGAEQGWPLVADVVTIEDSPAPAGGAATGIVRVTVTDKAGILTSTHRPGDAIGRVTFETGETRSLLSHLWAPVARHVGKN